MPRSEEANQRLREEQRARILEAAARVFARKGWAATMDDVATEAAVSHGLAYRYFPSKEALLTALVERSLQSPAASPERLAEAPGTPGERLRRVVVAMVESRRQPEPLQLLDQALADPATAPELAAMLRRRGEESVRALHALIVAGQGSGEVAAGDPDQLLQAILACVVGLTQRRATSDEHFPSAEIFLRMLKPESSERAG